MMRQIWEHRMDELLKSVHYTGSTCFSIFYSNITLFFSLFPFLMTFEIENIGQINNRLHALRSINKELLENQTRLDKERESKKLELIQYLNKQRTVLLHCNNQLHQQQTQLDSIRLEAYKWVNTHTHTHTQLTGLRLLYSYVSHDYRLFICSTGITIEAFPFHRSKRDTPTCSAKGHNP